MKLDLLQDCWEKCGNIVTFYPIFYDRSQFEFVTNVGFM